MLSIKPGFHPNAITCVGKQPVMVATASTEHPIGCKHQPIGCSVEAVATMISCLVLANASDCVWMETGPYYKQTASER